MGYGRTLVENGCLKKDREAFIQHLLDMGYTEKSLRNYKWNIKCLDHHMYECGITKYTSDIGDAFLREAADSGRHTDSVIKAMRNVVHRFDCFMRQEECSLRPSRVIRKTSPQFSEKLTGFFNDMRLKGLRESSVNQRGRAIQKALPLFDDMGIKDYSEITPKDIYEVFTRTINKQSFCDAFRSFLRYLFAEGAIHHDYSVVIPSIRKNRPIPSVYTAAETTGLLSSTETNVNTAKRNNAIILLGLRLGMRSGDIANLKITDIDFEGKEIRFVQEKTEVPQRLELLPEIEEALLEYISTWRRATTIPNVFISLKSPLRPITYVTIHNIITRRFVRAGVDTGERKHGGHALRMTLASELAAERVPYDAIRKILGHENPESIKHYVKFDIESLRSCSIAVSPPTGKLAAYMEERLGGEMR